MADNTTLNEGSGGDVIATDDISGVKHQRVKIEYGNDGSATDVSDANPLPVDDAGGSLTVDNAGTFAVQVNAALPAGTNAIGKLAANSGVDIGDVDVLTLPGVAGDVGHDAADSGNPIKVGAKAVDAEPTSVTANDRVDLIADLAGKLIVLPYANPENFISGTADAADDSDTAILAAAGAGIRNHVTSIVVHNSSSTDAYVTIKDGSTAKLVIPAPANSGATHTLPIPLRGTANTAINFAASASVTTMYVSAVGYKGA